MSTHILRAVPRVSVSSLDEITQREFAARRLAVPIAQATMSAQRTGFEGERDFCGACLGILGAASFGAAVLSLVAWIIF